jgi:DNA-binding GntR family transcriptional regulator
MNVKKAIKILKREGYIVQHHEKGFLVSRPTWDKPYYYSKRELINLARVWTSENNQNTAFKSGLKKEHKIKTRSSEKQAINHEEWEKIPPKSYPKTGNPWNHD